jgi:uncharacterized BrkB/YihY/UPF0761 family membrane protein
VRDSALGFYAANVSHEGANGAGVHDRNAETAIAGEVKRRISASPVRKDLLWLVDRVIQRCDVAASCDAAAEVSFYFVRSLFPFLLMLAGLLGWSPTTAQWNAGRFRVAIIWQDFRYAVLFNHPWRVIATSFVLWRGGDLIISLLSGEGQRWQWATPGSVVSVFSLSLTSSALNFYMNHAGNISRLYGTLAGSIVIMPWIYVANLSLLAGRKADAALTAFKTHPAVA